MLIFFRVANNYFFFMSLSSVLFKNFRFWKKCWNTIFISLFLSCFKTHFSFSLPWGRGKEPRNFVKLFISSSCFSQCWLSAAFHVLLHFCLTARAELCCHMQDIMRMNDLAWPPGATRDDPFETGWRHLCSLMPLIYAGNGGNGNGNGNGAGGVGKSHFAPILDCTQALFTFAHSSCFRGLLCLSLSGDLVFTRIPIQYHTMPHSTIPYNV